MKNLIYFLLLLSVISSCKYDDNPYAFTRVFDGGTYITPDGKVKYISGSEDSLIIVTDNYAIVQTTITYVNKFENGMLKDSILIYGHVYSTNPNPVVCGYDSVSKIDLLARLQKNSSYTFNGAAEPENLMTFTDLYPGFDFTGSFGLQYETDYYVRSFVVTGRIVGGEPEYKDIAYNQKTLQIRTAEPNDLWVGSDMLEAPSDFPDNTYWGATSFTHNGYIFVAQGHDLGPFGNDIVIHRYDPITKVWDNPYITEDVGLNNFTNAVCFVIENVPLGNQIYRDCVYIGLGLKEDGTDNAEFYRLDLEINTEKPLGQWGDWEKITSGEFGAPFPSFNVINAVAFSINGIGYVGLGEDDLGNASGYFSKFDPSDKTTSPYGKWTKIHDDGNLYPGGKRTQAICYTIGDNVYVGFGKDESGNMVNDFRMGKQITGDRLNWYSKASFPDDSLGRCEAVGFALGEMGYVGLGKNQAGVALRDFWRYNPFINLWERQSDFGLIDGLPVENAGLPRFEAFGAGVKYGNNLYRGYVGTGWAGNSATAHLYDDVWEYRP